MSAKKKPVSTPLHLLQQLTGSLLEHFEQACTEALAEAEKVLAKLEKQRVKVQEKLHKQRERIETAATAGKRKARTAVEALEQSLVELEGRQGETRQYIGELKSDIQTGLALIQGVSKVREATGKALEKRAVSTNAKPSATQKPVQVATVKGRASRSAKLPEGTASAGMASSVFAPTEPALTAPKARGRKPAPGEVAPLAEGVIQASAAGVSRRAPRKPRAGANSALANLTMAETPVTDIATD